MSRTPWLGRRPDGTPPPRAGGTRSGTGAGPGAEPVPQETAPAEAPPPRTPAPPDAWGLLGAPTMADALPEPLVSPVTDAARAAVAESAASLPAYVPPGAAPQITIDALGRKCPIPIILLAQQIRDVPVGSVIAVLADDPAAYSDIPAWCGLKSHDCAFRVDYATGWAFGVRRRY